MFELEREVREDISGSLSVISGLVSSASFVSLIAKLFRIGLSPVLNEFIEYYRRITHFFVDTLLNFLPFQLYDWYKDAFIVSFIFMLLINRASDAVLNRDVPLLSVKGLLLALANVLISAVCSVVLLGLLWGPVLVFGRPLDPKSEYRREKRAYIRSLMTMLAASAIFFALNSQL